MNPQDLARIASEAAQRSRQTQISPQTPPQTSPTSNTGLLTADQLNNIARANGTFGQSPNDRRTISSDVLGGGSRLNIPDIPQPTASTDLSGSVNSQADFFSQLIKQQEEQARLQKGETDKRERTFSDRLNQILDVGKQKEAMFKSSDIEGKTKAVTDLTNQLNAEQRALTKQVEAVRSNPSGLLSNAVESEVQRVTRNSLSKQADLAILQSAANNDLNTATNLIEQKINLQLEPLKLQLEYDEKFYNNNRDLLDKKEANAFQLKIEQAKSELQQKRDEQTRVYDSFKNAVQNGMTLPEQQQALTAISRGDVNGALALTGKYGVDPLDRQIKQAQLGKYRAESSQSLRTLPGPVQTRVQVIAGQFDNEQAVKNYQTIAETVNSVRSAGNSPTDDIQRIYAIAKVLDPNSAVREGEYKTVQDYATSLLQRSGLKTRRVFTNSGFLTEEARTFINTTLTNRLNASEKAYKNVYDEYGRRINKVTGQADGSEYITDYGQAFSDTSSSQNVNKIPAGYYQASDGLFYPI